MYSIKAIKTEIFAYIIKWVILTEKNFWNVQVSQQLTVNSKIVWRVSHGIYAFVLGDSKVFLSINSDEICSRVFRFS